MQREKRRGEKTEQRDDRKPRIPPLPYFFARRFSCSMRPNELNTWKKLRDRPLEMCWGDRTFSACKNFFSRSLPLQDFFPWQVPRTKCSSFAFLSKLYSEETYPSIRHIQVLLPAEVGLMSFLVLYLGQYSLLTYLLRPIAP